MKTLLQVVRRILPLQLQNPSFPASNNWRRFCSYQLSNSLPPPNSKLFVGGLSWSVDEKSLRDAFSSFGEVTEVRIMYDKESGRSRGFGFVNFLKEDEATCAKDAMDGKVSMLNAPIYLQRMLACVYSTILYF
ncbi:glycine-rich RNA-binding 4, mitochondrial [Olea europaea subsp. europaea]|uniref:Glycine-rich RNA-binding 4, mitochondrial n=1 Tax=Olea europaea subsp. europaea TaxID=158383 RepID=A0A8S0TU26_OLEEU|nr:glycine-rich RNA-binding 4, mitochondrial [Olea europaea subsp. europaea]